MYAFWFNLAAMLRYLLTAVLMVAVLAVEGRQPVPVVADSATRSPLPGASIYDCRGKAVGKSDSRGRMPHIPQDSYPVTVRYLGFYDRTVTEACADTVFLQEDIFELPEVVVESRNRKLLHILAYVREYSTLTTYTDTVFLFREKMVDYMLPDKDRKVKFKGWTSPRMLNSKSYYRFTNAYGLDSVSDVSNFHFSWSDWVGIAPVHPLPQAVRGLEHGSDTLMGRYSPVEVWMKNEDRLTVDVDVLAAESGREWVPNLSGFFRKDLDFEKFKVRFGYDSADDSITPLNLTGYSYDIESNGRGHDMFMFNKVGEQFFVSTHAEVYILDREYITVREARKWDARKFDTEVSGIYEPADAPALHPDVLALVNRVDSIDRNNVRLAQITDYRLNPAPNGDRNFKVGRRALSMLKQATGISRYKFYRNINRTMRQLNKQQMERNNARARRSQSEQGADGSGK